MPTQMTQRPTNTAYRNRVSSDIYRQYDNYAQARQNTARAYDFPATYPGRTAPLRPRPQATPQPKTTAKVTLKANILRIFLRIVLVAALCMTVLYRYAVILESSDQIENLKTEITAIEATNQSLQAKIDRGLELGTLEEYATGQLGMIRPDGSQIFYIDMQLADATYSQQGASDEKATNVLQGTPGALVHAFRVLK